MLHFIFNFRAQAANFRHISKLATASYAPSRVVARKRAAAQVTAQASRDKIDPPNWESQSDRR
jgi:hypothetical protein